MVTTCSVALAPSVRFVPSTFGSRGTCGRQNEPSPVRRKVGTRVMLKLLPGSLPRPRRISTAVWLWPMVRATGREPSDSDSTVRLEDWARPPQGNWGIVSSTKPRLGG